MLTAVLSDGMGSGDKACKDSELIIDFMEKFLEAGFAKETAVQMINGALIAGGENQNMSTLDMCQLDLYTGICEFIKIGSAPSYVKRENLVEQLSARNFPLGVFYEIDMETVRRRLMDGDYIIMLSDRRAVRRRTANARLPDAVFTRQCPDNAGSGQNVYGH